MGSGTFGTVYHGKWRGTDVAIKRINARCFAGKHSEQERMVRIFNLQVMIFSFHFAYITNDVAVVSSIRGMTSGMKQSNLQTCIIQMLLRSMVLCLMDLVVLWQLLQSTW